MHLSIRTVLVTSRAVLHVSGEHAFVVPPLQLPERDPSLELEQLSQYEAVRLFVERARAAKQDFQLTMDSAQAVAEVCRRLDGLPLAIELAAARVRVLAPRSILSRLDKLLDLLVGGPRDQPERHQTLRAAVEWSYSLLSERERILFRRLAVFAGGCDLEAAEAICARKPVTRQTMLDLLSGLAERSLLVVQVEQAGAVRYLQLETIREFALGELEQSSEARDVRLRHATFYCRLAEQAEADPPGVQGSALRALMVREQENLRAALDSARMLGDTEQGLRLAASLPPFWWDQGLLSEGYQWLMEFLALSAATPLSVLRRKALQVAGVIARSVGEYAAAETLLLEALTLASDLHDRARAVDALRSLGELARKRGDYVLAQSRYEESLALNRADAAQEGVAFDLLRLGQAAIEQRNYVDAQRRLKESLAAYRRLGNRAREAQVLGSMGMIALWQGENLQARQLLADGLGIQRDLDDPAPLANTLFELALVAMQLHDYADARALLAEGLLLHDRLGNLHGIAYCLDGFGALMVSQHKASRAVRLFAAAAEMRRSIGFVLSAFDRAWVDGWLQPARARLGRDKYDAAWADGRAMSRAAAIRCALGVDQSIPAAAAGSEVEPVGLLSQWLTPREHQVAALLASGRTNREIAETLTITLSKSERHVANILTKLGLRSRAQIAIWALKNGLVRDGLESSPAQPVDQLHLENLIAGT